MGIPVIGIIVAVYNAEQYICRCLDSILNQTFRQFCVIMIDDGSIDDSLGICLDYAQKDSRINIYHQENAGVSATRQYGTELMLQTGCKYCIHVDPDDWIEPRMLECLYMKAEEDGAEMVICDFWKDYPDRVIYSYQDPKSTKPEIVLNTFLYKMHGSLWNKLIKASCYKDYNIQFPKGINYCEDKIVVTEILLHISKITYLPKAFYHYDQYTNSDSLTRQPNLRRIQSEILYIKKMQELLGNSKYGIQCLNDNYISVKIKIMKYQLTDWKSYKKIYPDTWRLAFNFQEQISFRTRILLLMTTNLMTYNLVPIIFKKWRLINHRN